MLWIPILGTAAFEGYPEYLKVATTLTRIPPRVMFLLKLLSVTPDLH